MCIVEQGGFMAFGLLRLLTNCTYIGSSRSRSSFWRSKSQKKAHATLHNGVRSILEVHSNIAALTNIYDDSQYRGVARGGAGAPPEFGR